MASYNRLLERSRLQIPVILMRIKFQLTYANELSSNITQHNESKRLKHLTKIFSSVKFIEKQRILLLEANMKHIQYVNK